MATTFSLPVTAAGFAAATPSPPPPLCRAKDALALAPSPGDLMAEAPPSTILFVDDDAGNRRLLGALFRAAGFRVLDAGTGSEALELARWQRPDLVILDVNL